MTKGRDHSLDSNQNSGTERFQYLYQQRNRYLKVLFE